jgi:hypothetical protein
VSPMLSLSSIFTASSHLGYWSSPLSLWRVSDVHKYIYIYIYIFTYVNVQGKIVPLHFRIRPSLVTVRWGSCAWIEPMSLLR